jgi:hypothetical protein
MSDRDAVEGSIASPSMRYGESWKAVEDRGFTVRRVPAETRTCWRGRESARTLTARRTAALRDG